MTIYRTWPDMPPLLADLMTREWGGVVADVAGRARTPTPRPSSGWSATSSAPSQRLRENELFLRIVDLDPELILPYLFSRRGRSQDAHPRAHRRRAARGARPTGEVRAGNPAAMARAMLLAAHGFVLSAHTMVDDEVVRSTSSTPSSGRR